MKIPWETLKDVTAVNIKKEKIMYYIYCYTNKKNNHKYVGQTNNLKRRIREHRYCAFNEKASSYNDLLHKKIREYGEDNFEISLIETLYTEDIGEVNNRESIGFKKNKVIVELDLGTIWIWAGEERHIAVNFLKKIYKLLKKKLNRVCLIMT